MGSAKLQTPGLGSKENRYELPSQAFDSPFRLRRVDTSSKTCDLSSTRESGVDSRTLTEILDMVISELKEDENLHALDQADKDLALNKATAAMSKTLKKKLEKEVSMRIKGTIGGTLGGINIPKSAEKRSARKTNRRIR